VSRLGKRLRQLQLLVLDVDGVLTDGGLSYSPDGQVWRRFDVRDGLGLKLLQQVGLSLALISGGRSGAIERRAQDLGIEHCFTEVRDKQAQLQQLQDQLQVVPVATGFIGDDLNDLVVRSQVGVLAAPADGCKAFRRQADVVLRRPGGQGAVRELAERILKARGEWTALAEQGWRQRN
jgi:3-deoxy-D-manno-octulosonate 8-phosphate phosphatase (KDO 8-P phosphatase)